MVQVNSHGGGCCGARHLRGFGEAENNNPNLINTALSTVPPSRMTEVILNDTQVRSYPNILRRLAHLGFVLDGHWINGNHNSHNYRFSRCDNRQILELAGWNGMVMSPGLHGPLPRVPVVPTERDDHVPYEHPLPAFQITDTVNRHRYLGQLHAFRRGADGGIHAGTRYRIASPRSRYHNMELIALGRGNGGWDRNATIAFRDPVTRTRFEISAANCVLIVNQVEPPRPPDGANMREFVVGDRIQVTNTWGNYRRGLVGTVISVQGPQSVRIQFDTPGTDPTNSATNYVTIVDFDRQPDVPRTREEAIERVRRQRLAEAAPNPELPPHRHLEDEALAPAPVIPPPVARIVLTTYHCVFADGRRGAGYDTYDEAWAARGRRTRIDRRRVMSDGEIVWNERVDD